jgi:UDP-2-acetamido-2,6-beta-L-arabino-hexul-4-ose reductase
MGSMSDKNKIIKVGITGQQGFVGTHLYNSLLLNKTLFECIDFSADCFESDSKMDSFISNCDVIVHLAGKNRHNDPEVIYKTNIDLSQKIVSSCWRLKAKPHIIFASSTQEERDNLYGKSKKESRILFEDWAKKENAIFSGLIIPNVFGPFGNPYYNSVVATFCHQLTHGEEPKIDVDGEMKLIYVSELVKEIINFILFPKQNSGKIEIPHRYEIKVSELLNKLLKIKTGYFENGIIPNLDDLFTKNLFLTFLTYIDHEKFFPFMYKKNTDDRGSFVELVKLGTGGQISYSTTVPGITRGNHFHTRKAERFAVVKGKALIELRRIGTSEILSFTLDGNNPSFVDMPIWYTHNIKNIGEDELYTIFWINEFFDPKDPDTFFENV